MKKLFLGLPFVLMAAFGYAQGTIAFLNGPTTRHPIALIFNAPLVYGLFVGSSADSLSAVPVQPLAASSPATQGVMTGVPALYAIPGFDAGSTPWAQVRAWDASFGSDWQAAAAQGRMAQTDIRQLDPLGAPSGPGTIIWQGAAGTDPNRFYPIGIPEPATLTFGALAGAALLLRRRSKF